MKRPLWHETACSALNVTTCESCSCSSSWFGMGSDRRSTHAHVHHRVRNQGECYSSSSADSVLTQPWLRDCSLFFSLVGWPRVPRPRIAIGAASLPSIILTLPFHSEFQIPQNGIPHSNFLSHSKVEPLAPNTNIKSTTVHGCG